MSYLDRLAEESAIDRLWKRDPSLFTDDTDLQRLMADRMGWLGLAERVPQESAPWLELAEAWKSEGVTDVLLLGMGGSSLAPLVVDRVMRGRDHHPRLRVLDTTSPEQVAIVMRDLDPASCALLVASKSGTTVEPNSLYAVFRPWLEKAMPKEAAGGRCIAITDPGSPLETLARDEGFRGVYLAPPDVGGRFSALSVFGMLPAALIGVDLDGLSGRARKMEEACRRPAGENPAAMLGAWMAENAAEGRDKLTLAMSPGLEPFGLWIEQLVAESTGKDGRGILPVIEYDPSLPSGYGPDRMVVVIRSADDGGLAQWARELEGVTPVQEQVWDSALALGGEFVRWETAVALAGHLLGIEPFDQPNVAEAKKATSDILTGRIQSPAAGVHMDGVAISYGGDIAEPATVRGIADAVTLLVDGVAPGDYLAILAYMPEDSELLAALERAAIGISHEMGVPVCVQLGPRYLHSTGQYHKGGPETGSFLILTAQTGPDVEVPGREYTLRRLNRAQAEGDMETLAAHGRPVMRLDLPFWDARALRALSDDLIAAEN